VECLGGHNCFLAGDVRVNEQLGLLTMHTIWMREHNRIADELARLNTRWDSETVFQVARQIVGAELQKITFQDYLPLLLGEGMELISKFSYDANTNPGIPNAFATAAFRFGHSQIRPQFDRLDQNFQPLSIGPLSLIDSFFQPNQYSASGGTDPILRGLLARQARRTDEFVNDVLTNHLFQTNASSHGMDLASLNIQRGRDHGLPPYMTWKRWAKRECGVSSDFNSDLTMVRLLQTYGTLETVDLWVGGLAEKPLPGGVLGATFACIFARTFSAIRNGDRFYYDNTDLSNATFTSQQRAAINNASLSRVICDNADNIQEIQPNAFRGDQPREPCTSLPMVDLTAWMNPCYIRLRINRQMMDASFRSFSMLQNSSESTMEFVATIPQGERSACLPFVCPKTGTTTNLMVSPDGNTLMGCSVRPNRWLPDNMAITGPGGTTDTYIGNIARIHEIRGLYRELDRCERRYFSRTGLRYTCGSTGPDQLSKDAIVVQELAGELQNQFIPQETVQTQANKLFGKEISINDPMIPKDIQMLLQDQAFMQKLSLEEDNENDDSEDPDLSNPDSMETVVGLLQNAIDQLKDMEDTRAGSEDLTACYIRLSINRQMMDASFRSFSVLRNSSVSIPNTTMEFVVTIPQGETSACLPFLCPIANERTTTNLMVSPDGNTLMECSVQPNSKLPENMATPGSGGTTDTYIGNIRILRGNHGLYSNLDKCERRNSRTGLAYMCGSTGPDQLSKDAIVVQELAGQLQNQFIPQETVQTQANKLFGKEISINDPMIPKDIQMLLQDQAFMQKLSLEEDNENDDSEDPDLSNPDSMETVVGLLQNAIDQLKDMEDTRAGSEDQQVSKDGGMMDQKNPKDLGRKQDKVQSSKPPGPDGDPQLSKLVSQLQDAVDELDG
jgi:hypothetical protein